MNENWRIAWQGLEPRISGNIKPSSYRAKHRYHDPFRIGAVSPALQRCLTAAGGRIVWNAQSRPHNRLPSSASPTADLTHPLSDHSDPFAASVVHSGQCRRSLRARQSCMRAREIASHRYGHADDNISVSVAQHELLAEYRNLLLGNTAATTYHRYVKLVCQLLDCSSAVLLSPLDNSGKQIARCDSGAAVGGAIGASFCDLCLSPDAVLTVEDVESESTENLAWRAQSPEVKAFAGVIIASDNIRVAVVVAVESHARCWTLMDIEKLKNVSEMIRADLSIARERHQMAVQKRMQRSLVQFVRGNLPSTGPSPEMAPQETRIAPHSLYSDFDEDLETDDADDEADQLETGRMNTMFDFSCRLIRRTLQVAGCVLVNIENVIELDNIEADIPCRSTIMGACFLKHLRSAAWHENFPDTRSVGSGSGPRTSAHSSEMSSTAVPHSDAFDPRGLGGPWLRSLLESYPRAVSFDEDSLPEAIKQLLPAGLQSCLLSPIYDSNAKAFALIIVFHDQKGEFTKADCHYVEAFGSSIYAEVLNQSLQRANDAKALFISKISHEFRTPLHGILASAEFLNDMPDTTPTQLGFVRTVDTCGRTLLEIINHILDFSKLSFGNSVLETEPPIPVVSLEDFDVLDVAEQVVSTAFSSYEFKKINDHLDVQKTNSQQSRSESDSGSLSETIGRNVEVIVQAEHRPQGYTVYSDLGAFRRILLNLLGNALKYTHLGHIILRLSLQAHAETPGLETLEIAVTDTGIGIATPFLIEMFKPFTQEDEFSTGTGLGLSIVKELTTKMHGKIDVKTRKHLGSQFTVSYPAMTHKSQATLFPGAGHRRDLYGVKFHYLTPDLEAGESARASDLLRSTTIQHLTTWFGMILVEPEAAQILVADDTTQELGRLLLQEFQGPLLTLCSTTTKYERSRTRRSSPLQSFLVKPCGPHKLGEGISQCLALASNISRLDSVTMSSFTISNLPSPKTRHDADGFWDDSPPPSMSSTVRDTTNRNITGGTRRSIQEEQNAENLEDLFNKKYVARNRRESLARRSSTSQAVPVISRMSTIRSPVPENGLPDNGEIRKGLSEAETAEIDPLEDHPVRPVPHETSTAESLPVSVDSTGQAKKKHILIVEDNPINMMLLVSFAKQHKLTATTAANGKIAFERVRDRPKNYDAILMDINMPICNGFEAMQLIRDYEKEHQRPRSNIAALTGLSSEEDHAKAAKHGANAFFTKPIKMKELSGLLRDWQVLPPVAPVDNSNAVE